MKFLNLPTKEYFQLEQFTQRSVKLVASSIEMLSDTELTQYTIKTWTLDEGKASNFENDLRCV